MKVLRGIVVSGRRSASRADEQQFRGVAKRIKEKLVPGTLNVTLDKPVRLSENTAIFFGSHYSNWRGMVWPAKIGGLKVWLFRWPTVALHVVEILSCYHLRRKLGLQDGDRVDISIDESNVLALDRLDYAAWLLFWARRRYYYYSEPEYAQKIFSRAIRFGSCQVQGTVTQNSLGGFLVGAILSRIPGSKALLHLLKHADPAKVQQEERKRFLRLPPDSSASMAQQAYQRIGNLLEYSKLSGTDYSAKSFPAGYHSMEVAGNKIQGRRDPEARFSKIPIDFTGKRVLDIGSNQGGMLHMLRNKIKWGVGIDIDPKMINVANAVANSNRAFHLNFFTFDLDKEPLSLIQDFLPEEEVDVIFLFAVCMWITQWRQVIDFCRAKANILVFESNGTDKQQKEQIDYLKTRYSQVGQLKDDDEGGAPRRLLMCIAS